MAFFSFYFLFAAKVSARGRKGGLWVEIGVWEHPLSKRHRLIHLIISHDAGSKYISRWDETHGRRIMCCWWQPSLITHHEKYEADIRSCLWAWQMDHDIHGDPLTPATSYFTTMNVSSPSKTLRSMHRQRISRSLTKYIHTSIHVDHFFFSTWQSQQAKFPFFSWRSPVSHSPPFSFSFCFFLLFIWEQGSNGPVIQPRRKKRQANRAFLSPLLALSTISHFSLFSFEYIAWLHAPLHSSIHRYLEHFTSKWHFVGPDSAIDSSSKQAIYICMCVPKEDSPSIGHIFQGLHDGT